MNEEIITLYKQLINNKENICTENLTGEQIFYQMEDNLYLKLKLIEKELKNKEKYLLKELFFIKKNNSFNKSKDIPHEKKEIKKTVMQHECNDNLTADEMLKLFNESCSNEFEFEAIESGESEIEFN